MGHGGDGAAIPDRSNVHILLCDKDSDSGLQVMQMLQRCSYQVTCVKSAGQVVQVLDSSCGEVDLILTEVELPKEKGFKLLKNIVRQEQLQHIPVVMMSLQDEMAVVVRCLKLGAVDFLLKPLRKNELLNLWTHTWRRRRMLGLTERHLMKGNIRVPFDLLVSETSESNNTNSTNFFSEDTEDHRVIPNISVQTYGKCCNSESKLSPQLELSLKPSVEVTMSAISEHGAGSIPSPPRKSELKVGQSSAFFEYSKVTIQPVGQSGEATEFDNARNNVPPAGLRTDVQSDHYENDGPASENGDEQESFSNSTVDRSGELAAEKLCNTWESFPCNRNKPESGYREQVGFSANHVQMNTDLLGSKLNFVDPFLQEDPAIGMAASAQFLVGRVMGQVMHCPPPILLPGAPMYQSLLAEDGVPAGIVDGIPSLHMPQGVNLRSTFPFNLYGLHMIPSSQLGPFPAWHPALPNPILERKPGHAERREAALNKFRLKRKDRCFEKKIRYASRKKLAEQRPRIKGQFVRRETDTDINDSGALDDDDDDEDDQGICEDGSSPESIAEDV